MIKNQLQMKTAVFAGPKKIDVCLVNINKPKAGQIRVKLQGCGICTSNLPVWQGREWFKYPLSPGYPGHEGWGIIDEVGEEVENFNKGQRVTFFSDHSYAEYENIDTVSAVKLPAEFDEYHFPGEPFSCANNIFKRSEIQKGQKVAIIGAGFLGAMLTSLITSAGAEVIAISKRPFSLSVARRKGAAHTIVFEDKYKVIQMVHDLTNGSGCPCIIEAIGNQQAIDLASELVGIRGRLVIAGYHQDGLRNVNMQTWNWKGIDVINAHEREMAVYINGIRESINAMQNNNFWPFDLLTHEYSIEQLPDAFENIQSRPDGFVKAYLKF